jgi:hypothetical protein
MSRRSALWIYEFLTRFVVSVLICAAALSAQRRVDPKFTYTRVICVVPIVGSGTSADPKRPQYAPLPRTAPNQPLPGIIAYMQQISDDGKYALVEYVAKDQSALQTILNDKSIKVFIKGKDKKGDIETELKKYKKDFDLNQFGLVMP